MHKYSREQMFGRIMALLLTGLLSASAGTGCVIPPPMNKEVDGGVNRPPTIKWDHVNPPVGPKSFYPTQSEDSQIFTIGFRDLDRQPIHVRMFVNGAYEKKIPISKEKTTGGEEDGTIQFKVTGVCAVHLKGAAECSHMVEVYISDSGFVDETSGAKDLRTPLVGGLRDSVAWWWKCEK